MSKIQFEYFAPETIEETVALLQAHGEGCHVMAGGTDLLVKIQHRVTHPKVLVGLGKIKELKRISFSLKSGLTIGAMASLADVAAHPKIKKHFPSVAHAAASTANVQVRNKGTVVGNICNASPSADNIPTLLVLGSRVNIAGPDGETRMPLADFFLGPGISALKPGQFVTSLNVPVPETHTGTAYLSLSQRGQLDCSAVGVAAMVVMDKNKCKDARIAVGACAPIPMRTTAAEKMLIGKPLTHKAIEAAAVRASKETKPITDVRASAAYRWKMVAVLTIRALIEAQKNARKQ
ncbi:MAG: xanthine dehydrogenase family protein subunit M [Desulfobacteraceae bacterium]|nr:xanthine dehydrogenase family protein subunit M [Desulfobacteraceae bacterium]